MIFKGAIKIEEKFYIGDRVRLIYDHPDHGPLRVGITGTIKDIFTDAILPYGVEWDKDFIDGHNLHGKITSHRGWYVMASYIELVEEELDYDMVSASDKELSLLLYS